MIGYRVVERFADVRQLSQVESVMYCPIVILVKVSILLQYVSIFVVNRGNTFHYIVHLILWLNVIFYTIVFFLVTFQVHQQI